MTLPVDTILVIVILTGFLILGTARLITAIRLSAIQGVCIGLLPVAASGGGTSVRVLLLGLAIVILKGVVFPRLLRRAIRESRTSGEMQPYVGITASVITGILALVAAFWLDARMDFLPDSHGLVAPTAFFTIITGLFLIVARKLAITQVIGYLILENGIYVFGLAIALEVPVIVELGVLLDMFVAVFVMGIAIFRINREFNHMDSDQLRNLKG